MRQRLEAVFSFCRQHFLSALIGSNNLQISSTIAWLEHPLCPEQKSQFGTLTVHRPGGVGRHARSSDHT
jgi:hypothetical protein